MSRFFFNTQPVEAQPGDTVASALYRAGRRIFTRSFKYHRPRGLLCLSGKCPNCLMNVDGIPNVRTCMTPAVEGMQVRHQNAYPSLERDWLAVAQRFDALMPVGWYYKTFTHAGAWHRAEPYIRKAAGLGRVPLPDAMRRITNMPTSRRMWRSSAADRRASKRLSRRRAPGRSRRLD